MRHWLGAEAKRVTFVALSPWGRFAALPHGAVAELHAALTGTWGGRSEPAQGDAARRLANAVRLHLLAGRGRAELDALLKRERRSVFLLVSHRSLERQAPILRLCEAGASFVPLVHDLIPATHPEYARPGVTMQHLRRIATVAKLADGILVNSVATKAVLRPHLVGRKVPVRVAPLGIEALPDVPPMRGEPYFVALGTIEPRKNHLLLLHLWRDFAQKHGPTAPRLLLVGRRGWENENVLDMIERCTLLRGLVAEAGQLSDHEIAALLRGARALLFPSFAEGYGLPLAEALALGAPAICSDLPALREIGGDVPEYLDPLDGAGWRRTILDYARDDSRARHAQLVRLRSWHPPDWTAHFAAVENLLEEVVGHRSPRHAAMPAIDPRLSLPGRPPMRVAAADLTMS